MALYLADAAPPAPDPTATPAPAPAPDKLGQEVAGFMLRFGSSKPSSTDVANFLVLYPTGVDRDNAARALIAAGVDANIVAAALNGLATMDSWSWKTIGGVAAIASAAVCGYHGYRRNKSIWWAGAWFVLGGIFPIFTPVVALAQGFAKPRGA